MLGIYIKFLSIESQRDLLMIIYVGDSKDVIKRIRTNHCKGNVEASALRKYVAEALGYRIKITKRSRILLIRGYLRPSNRCYGVLKKS